MAAAAGEPTGTVFNVQRASFHDGPGIRTTVFLKGCPLRCPWCHNPEGMASAPEVLVNGGRCLGCASCAAACPRPGGPLPAGSVLGSEGCTACRRCAAACPTGAREVAGQEVAVSGILREALRDRIVYDESGGGVTFSGGEPLAQADFLLACLVACRAAGLHVAVDTCGFAGRATVTDVARSADLLLWDIKVLDRDAHLSLTGAPLRPILDNLEAAAGLGIPIWLRVPVIPGVNDDEKTMLAAARIAAVNPAVRRVCLLPFHRTADGKRARLGLSRAMGGVEPPSEARMRELAGIVERAGVAVSLGG